MRQRIHPVVFPLSAGLIVVFSVLSMAFSDTSERVLTDVLGFVTDTFGWFLIATVAGLAVLCLVLIVGPYGSVRLGPDDATPDYGHATWFAMLFSAGMGIGLVYWAVAEPLTHLAQPPRADPGSAEAAQDAMVLTFHHWGIGPWAVYAVLGASLAYFGYRHGLPLGVRSALYPLIGERMNGWMGHLVDTAAVLGTMFGVATSLGLGVMQLNAGLEDVFDIGISTGVQVALVAVITLIATISVMSGLDRGIRLLSQGNLIAATALLVFVALAGPTVVLLGAYLENTAGYISRFLETITWTGTYEGDGWLSDWTLFYWAWWISWSPFVGMFIARISRGRTIREFTLGVLIVPTLVSFLWFTVMGNTAIDIQLSGAADLVDRSLEDPSFGLFAMLAELPFGTVTTVLAMGLIVIFFVTSSDSGSFVISLLSTRGSEDAPGPIRLFWALAEGLLAAALLLAGGLVALQAGAVAMGLPFAMVLVIVAFGLMRGLRAERAGRPPGPSLETGDDDSAAPEADRTRAGRDPTTGANGDRAGHPVDQEAPMPQREDGR
nr:BCCT family transporter [Rhabdothermincola salaria]